MRVVLDTNILISACWSPDGIEKLVLSFGLAGRFEIATSPDLWTEYRDVLGRAKFAKLRDRIDPMLVELAAKALLFSPQVRVSVASDEDDNRVLECALASHAGYVVTGNLKHFPVDWPHARIVNARQFLTEHGEVLKGVDQTTTGQ